MLDSPTLDAAVTANYYIDGVPARRQGGQRELMGAVRCVDVRNGRQLHGTARLAAYAGGKIAGAGHALPFPGDTDLVRRQPDTVQHRPRKRYRHL